MTEPLIPPTYDSLHAQLKAVEKTNAALRAQLVAMERELTSYKHVIAANQKEFHVLEERLEQVERERDNAESFLARIASLRIDETGTACFSNATDGRGIDGWRVAERARQTFEQLAIAQARVTRLEKALQRLATLGGGRSEGNCIAQEALAPGKETTTGSPGTP